MFEFSLSVYIHPQMLFLNAKILHVLILMMIVLPQIIGSNEGTTCTPRAEQKCPLPLTVLDFVYNFSKPDIEIIWPCEVRYYWLSLKPFVKLVRFLIGNVTPFIIILGVIFNTISFGMLSTSVLSDTDLSLYLRALAISDNGALVFNYAVGIAKSNSKFVNDLFMNSRFLCGMNSVSMELFQFTSTWLVVLLTWARVFAIIFPFGTRNSNRNHFAVISISILTCISFIISLTKLYSGGYETDSIFEFIPCQKKIKPWGCAMYFYIALSTWLPLICIFIGNVLLIIHMRKSNKIHKQLTQNSRQKPNKVNRTSRTLFTVSIVYLILLLPLGIVETLELYWDVILTKHPSDNAQENTQYVAWLKEKMLLKWCRGLCFHIYHWNFALNFFLYYLTGEKFRSIVIQTLKNYKNSLCTKNVLTCSAFWSNCSKHLASVRFTNVLLIRIITLNDQYVHRNITVQNNSDGIIVT